MKFFKPQINSKALEYLQSLVEKKSIRVLFVCLGNICRSPAAEGVFKKIVEEGQYSTEKKWEIDSAGTGNYHVGDLPDRRMRIHASRRGYELNHHARQFKELDFDDFDLIIPMDASNERFLRRMAPAVEDSLKIIPMASFFSGKACHYDYVPDPYYEGAEGFELVLDLLENSCRNLYEFLS